MKHILAYTLDAAYSAAHDKADETGIPQHLIRVGQLYEVTADPRQCNERNYIDTVIPDVDADSELVGNPPEEPTTVTPTHGSSPGTDEGYTGRCYYCGDPCEPGGGFAEYDDFCVACGELYGPPEK